jgi:hypothetical protein
MRVDRLPLNDLGLEAIDLTVDRRPAQKMAFGEGVYTGPIPMFERYSLPRTSCATSTRPTPEGKDSFRPPAIDGFELDTPIENVDMASAPRW